MKNVLTILSALILFGVTFRYSYLILKHKIVPTLTTWLLFSIASGLSLLTYFSSSNHSISGNIINVMDLVMCWSILISLIIVKKKLSLAFSRFEKVCLVLTGIILLFWLFTKEDVVANLLLQLILTIAYLPTITKLWRAKESQESFGMWLAIVTASFLGFVSGLVQHDLLGSIYAFRSFVSVAVVLVLMIRIRHIQS